MDEPKENSSDDQTYQLYLEDRKLLVDAERESARAFDKAILTLASGAFGFSIAFLKNIVPNPFANTLWLLGCAWIAFSLCIIVILFSFLSSQLACRHQIDITYDELMSEQKRKNFWATVPDFCNFASILILAIAFSFWGCFVYWNVIYK